MKQLKLLLSMASICMLLLTTNALATNQVVKLSIENMTCKMCDITVRKAFEKVDGVTEATVDYETKTAQVTFNPEKTTVTKIEEASTMAGYPAKLIIE
ncbi:cation transporter [Marinicella rhabdoformis]|uniref:cation transporter n=1 Tax=Marinicella rhabdoformis TaxID=2580566 RepID=UPI0012AEDAC9|nr:cation transporter [Marinicella rhabdoformis]